MKLSSSPLAAVAGVLGLTSRAAAIDLDTSDSDSICEAISLISDGVMDYYQGTRYGGIVGMFQDPYYWWEAGEAFGSLLGMWHFCQNDTYEDIIYDALMAQRGSDYDYVPSNQSTTEGNDDQGFWGLAVMEAAERNFTNPSGEDDPGWLALGQAVFNTMWARWDTADCGGGLRWQIFTWNSGYTYKNTISTACMFTIAARLGRYTGNETYIDIANTAYEWLVDVGYVIIDGDTASVYDGAEISTNCTEPTTIEWSYNMALLMAGCAYAYNATESDTWLERTEYFVQGASVFFDDNIMYERACQGSGSCNTDQRSFKSIFSRCLGQTAMLAPTTYDTIWTWIEDSAAGAAKSCTGGTDGHTCGLDWTLGSNDAIYGLGEQISALEIMNSLLINDRPAPYSNQTGGTSEGNAALGSDTDDTALSTNALTITGKDKAGGGILTAVVLAVMTGGAVWMVI